MIKIIPGAISRNSARFLIILPAHAAGLQVVGSKGEAVVHNPVPVSARLAAELQLPRTALQLHLAEASQLAADTEISLQVSADPGLQRSVTLRTMPGPQQIAQTGLNVLLAGCYYEGFGQAPQYLAAMRAAGTWFGTPAFKLLLGDNLYVDVVKGQRGFSTDAYGETAAEYKKYWYDSAYAEVLAYLPTFTAWDDHEFWNNYPEWQNHLRRTWDAHYDDYKDAAQDCLAAFQAPLNPPAVAGAHSYLIDADPISFFVADLRADRQPHDDQMMMNAADLAALEAWLAGSADPKVLVLGQPLWIEGGGRMSDFNPPDFSGDYARILRAIATSPGPLLIVSSDVHHSRILRFKIGGKEVVEFITSPACHIPTSWSIINNSYSSQGQGSVEYPDDIRAGGFHLRAPEYLAGSTAPNTFAVVNLRPLGSGLELSWVFVDSNTFMPAASAARNTGSWYWPSSEAPSHGSNYGVGSATISLT